MPDCIEPATLAKDQLAQLGNQALQDLYANLTSAKAFALEQAPEVCRQMIAWQITAGIACVILALILVPMAIIIWVRFLRAERADPCEMHLGQMVLAVATSVAVLPAMISAMIQGAGALQAIIAPKLFLVEAIFRLLKGA